MFGIELSSDILIVAIFIQMGMIAILIFTVFFRLNIINSSSSPSSTTNDTELDKKVEKKLTGMQIRLNDILTEISSATKEQKESISNMTTTVKAAADSIAAAASLTTATTSTNAIPAAAAAASAIPFAKRVSSLTLLTQKFGSPILTAPNINASTTASTISTNNPTRFISGLFDRSDGGTTHKSENYLNNQLQDTDYSPSESKISPFHDEDRTILKIKENKVNGGRGEKVKNKNDISQNQNNNEVKDLEIEKIPLDSEKNSNSELDKIDEEILSALQRLGGNYESKD